MKVTYVARPVYPPAPPTEFCVVEDCMSDELDHALWVTVEGHQSKLPHSRQLGPCCAFHGVVVPGMGIGAYSFTDRHDARPVVTPAH